MDPEWGGAVQAAQVRVPIGRYDQVTAGPLFASVQHGTQVAAQREEVGGRRLFGLARRVDRGRSGGLLEGDLQDPEAVYKSGQKAQAGAAGQTRR